jgi:acetoin utilization protein AcuB
MFIRDVMKADVVTITSDTSIYDAREAMRSHRIERLPVVDNGKLVGIFTKHEVLKALPPPGMARSIWEYSLILHKTQVANIMKTPVITADPDMPVEDAVALAQQKKIGCLVIVKDNIVAGIVTTNDFFYKILNPLLGIGIGGSRLYIHRCDDIKSIQDILESLARNNVNIVSLYSVDSSTANRHDLVIHMKTEDASQIVKEIEEKGYSTELRLHHITK